MPTAPAAVEPTASAVSADVAKTVTCKGPGATRMVVVKGIFLYDVVDPARPRLICRATAPDGHSQAILKIAGPNRIAVGVPDGVEGAIYEMDLVSDRLTRVGTLKMSPTDQLGGYPYWTADGSVQLYWKSIEGPQAFRGKVEFHLWSNGRDHLLETADTFGTGFVSRWGTPRGITAPSPDGQYFAVSFLFGSFRIYSITDGAVVYDPHVSSFRFRGGAWAPRNRLVWVDDKGVHGWSATAGPGPVTGLRSEVQDLAAWPGGAWLAYDRPEGDRGEARVGAAGGDGAYLGPYAGFLPGFVTSSTFWFAAERTCTAPCGVDGSESDGTVHFVNTESPTEKLVIFAKNDGPTIISGSRTMMWCCEISDRWPHQS